MRTSLKLSEALTSSPHPSIPPALPSPAASSESLADTDVAPSESTIMTRLAEKGAGTGTIRPPKPTATPAPPQQKASPRAYLQRVGRAACGVLGHACRRLGHWCSRAGASVSDALRAAPPLAALPMPFQWAAGHGY